MGFLSSKIDNEGQKVPHILLNFQENEQSWCFMHRCLCRQVTGELLLEEITQDIVPGSSRVLMCGWYRAQFHVLSTPQAAPQLPAVEVFSSFICGFVQ